jgi:repressor LexA
MPVVLAHREKILSQSLVEGTWVWNEKHLSHAKNDSIKFFPVFIQENGLHRQGHIPVEALRTGNFNQHCFGRVFKIQKCWLRLLTFWANHLNHFLGIGLHVKKVRLFRCDSKSASVNNCQLTAMSPNTTHVSSMDELTKKQRAVLNFVSDRQQSEGNTPTLREIAAHFKFKSSRAAADHLAALKRKGFLESESGKARSLRIISPLVKLRHRIVDIPIFGSIPAGIPQAREQEAEGCVSVDIKSIGIKTSQKTFALRVAGDSMIGKQICNGDIVVLEFGPEPRSGQIVAAYVDGQSTLKTFIVKNGKPFLRAENPKYPNLVPAEELTIQGVFKALIRRAQE